MSRCHGSPSIRFIHFENYSIIRYSKRTFWRDVSGPNRIRKNGMLQNARINYDGYEKIERPRSSLPVRKHKCTKSQMYNDGRTLWVGRCIYARMDGRVGLINNKRSQYTQIRR